MGNGLLDGSDAVLADSQCPEVLGMALWTQVVGEGQLLGLLVGFSYVGRLA